MKSAVQKLLMVMIMISMLILMVPQLTLAADIVSGDFTYTVAAGEATITKYTGTATNLSIPSTLDTYPVKAIGAYAFYGNVTLANVTIPEGVTTLGDYAFQNMTELVTITIPSTVATIGTGAFTGDTKLISITLPHGITQLSEWLFSGDTSLTSITLPDTLVSIGDYAIYYCPKLESLALPATLKTLGRLAIGDCYKLTSIVIPDGVTTIGPEAFRKCNGLTSVTIPATVNSIGAAAFYQCSGLTSIVIPDAITIIETDTFLECTGLTSIIIPDNVTQIGQGAFQGCTGLTTVDIPQKVTSIKYVAFNGCTNLVSAHFLGNAPLMEYSVFDLCAPDFTVLYEPGATGFTTPKWYYYVGDSSTFYPARPYSGTEQPAPSAPVAGSKTATSVTLNAITGAEYRVGTGDWQASPVFTGLSPNTEYTFYARMAATSTLLASPASEGTVVRTDKLAGPAAPTAPAAGSVTATSVTLNTIAGAEYRIGSGAWQTSPEFTGLSPNTAYTFYARMAETATQMASDASASTVLTTSKLPSPAAPSAPTMAGKTSTSITLASISGAEYRLGTGAWQSSPVFTGLQPGTEYTFTIRIAETETALASAESQALTVTTYLSDAEIPVTGEQDHANLAYLLFAAALLAVAMKSRLLRTGKGKNRNNI